MVFISQKFTGSDFRVGVSLSAPALSISWAIASNLPLRLFVVSLSLYSGIALLIYALLEPIQRRIVFQSVSAETSQSLVCSIRFLVAASIAHFISQPPFNLFMQFISFMVCGIACYTILPFSRLLTDTLGIIKGILASWMLAVVISPIFIGLVLIFMSGGRNTSSSTIVASSVLGQTDRAEINFLALILTPLVAAILGTMDFSKFKRKSSI